MDKTRVPFTSRLFQHSSIECKDELDDKYESCYQALLQTIQGKGDKEISDSLNMEAMKSHENICTGLLVGILTEPSNCIKYYSYLGFVANDGLNFVVVEVNRILVEKYINLKEVVQQQLIWLVRELVRSGVAGAGDVCWNTMRNIIGGNTSTRNLWLADQMMNIFMDNKAWLFTLPQLVSGVIYTYLRLLQDHVKPNLKELGEKEVTFVIQLIRERFSDVLTLGRDFIRLIQSVARIPEIEELWQEMLFSPSLLDPSFTGLEQIMKTGTPRKFLISRITPSMEKKLKFLTHNVKFGSHTRYEGWFLRSHLSSQESQSLRPDIIRFIVSVIHPPLEIIQSTVMPRWAVIGWILTSCTNQVTSSNVKLALFYDWIFFNIPSDSIMHLEPAVLVMHHSMKTHPQVTATLLDFLTRLVNSFHPSCSDQILLHVTTAFKHVQERGLVTRLSQLLFSSYLSSDLRNSVIETFETLYLMENQPIQQVSFVPESFPSAAVPPPVVVEFSDDEDNSDDDKLMIQETSPAKKLDKPITNGEVDGMLYKIISNIESIPKADEEQQSTLLSQVMKSILARPVFAEDSKLLAESLSENLTAQFKGKLFHSPSTPTSLQLCLSQPIFSLFHCLTDPRKDPIMELLANLQFLQPRLGYSLLLFLTSSPESEISQEDKITLYSEFCQAMGTDCSLGNCLVRDLTQCQDDDVDLFLYLIPHLYRLLPQATLGNVPLLYLIVSCVDGSQIMTLVSKIVSQQLILLHGNTCMPIMEASLKWETFEQYAFWHIYNAHELPIKLIQNFLPKLSAKTDAEALTNVMFILKKKVPTVEVLSKCLTREPAGDDFLSSLCCFWMKYAPKVLPGIVAALVTKCLGQEGGRKRKADPRLQEKPIILQLLGHFTPVIRTCKELFKNSEVIEAFIKLGLCCLQTTKVNHPELFELLESLKTQSEPDEEGSDQQASEDDNSPPPSPMHKKIINSKKPRRCPMNVNYREVDSSDDDEGEMMPTKKRKM